jgi:quinolinate synthase
MMIDVKGLTDAQVDGYIWKIKRELGDGLFIPVHHYQRDEVVQFADCIGDSLELSRMSAGTPSRCILFCGVYFMAEIARTLASEDQQVHIPNPSAGCPLADFAFHKDVEYVWELLQELHPGEYVPVTYANSHIEVKAFCGENEGFVCTSSNAQKIFSHILMEKKRVFFLPDKNLGLNTAAALGMTDNCCVVDRHSQDILRLGECSIVVWNGFCIVHRVFTLGQVKEWREREPEARIIVHPECDPDVVQASDESGSTSKIKTMVEGSPEGSKWVIGTEYNMVRRLKRENPGKLVEPLEVSICENMSKNSRRDLLETLLAYRSGDSARQVVLPAGVKENALRAISRMLRIS